MATPESIGTAACGNCGREVFVRENRSGFPYYRCDCCGVEFRHHIRSAGEKWKREKIKGNAPENPANSDPAPADPAPKKSTFQTLLG